MTQITKNRPMWSVFIDILLVLPEGIPATGWSAFG